MGQLGPLCLFTEIIFGFKYFSFQLGLDNLDDNKSAYWILIEFGYGLDNFDCICVLTNRPVLELF